MAKVDPFARHEALHMTHVLSDSIQRHLCEHPFVAGRPDLKAFADAAAEALENLYQAIGSIDDD